MNELMTSMVAMLSLVTIAAQAPALAAPAGIRAADRPAVAAPATGAPEARPRVDPQARPAATAQASARLPR